MHRELGQLAGKPAGEQSSAAEADDGFLSTANDRSFSEFVRDALRHSNEPVLRYSQRLALLDEAERRGVNRFQANLIIASVQHRMAIGSFTQKQTRSRRRWVGVVAFVIFQALIVWGFWQVVRA